MMDFKSSKYIEYKKLEEEACMIGWDFSFLEGLIEEDPLPFNYTNIVKKYLKKNMQLLDMETGAGEVLLMLEHPYENTTVTEGYQPNYELCLDRLLPLGINVYNALGENCLPFKDNSFDIVINRHGAYLTSEIKRILKPNGLFITQQVGGDNNSPLSSKLGLIREKKNFSLDLEINRFEEAGFDILYSDECYQNIKYKHIKAVIAMAKIIHWEFPRFTVDSCLDSLLAIEKDILNIGYVHSIEHRFCFVVKLKGGN